jgi:hypothetical protein
MNNAVALANIWTIALAFYWLFHGSPFVAIGLFLSLFLPPLLGLFCVMSFLALFVLGGHRLS